MTKRKFRKILGEAAKLAATRMTEDERQCPYVQELASELTGFYVRHGYDYPLSKYAEKAFANRAVASVGLMALSAIAVMAVESDGRGKHERYETAAVLLASGLYPNWAAVGAAQRYARKPTPQHMSEEHVPQCMVDEIREWSNV